MKLQQNFMLKKNFQDKFYEQNLFRNEIVKK